MAFARSPSAPCPSLTQGLFAREEGRGEAVILLHGGLLDHGMFAPLQHALADSYRTISLDLPGFGRSAPLEKDGVDPDELASAVAAFMRSRGIESAHVVGLSLGGAVAVRLARNHAALARTLVLIGVGGSKTLDPPARPEPIMAEGDRDAFLQRFAQQMLGPDGSEGLFELVLSSARSTSSRSFVGLLALMRDYPDVLAEAQALPLLTLLVAGEYDQPARPSGLAAAARRMRSGQSIIVPGAGHLAPLEQPAFVAAALHSFWSGS